MFFRPEEDGLFSKRIDDVFFLKRQEVHIRHKDQGFRAFFLDPVIEITVDRELHRLFAVRAFGADRDCKLFIS